MADHRQGLRLGGWLLAALALFVALALVVGPRAAYDWARDHSSTRKNPWGLAACRELIERLEVPTATWDRPLTELDGEVQMLMLLDPLTAVGDEEQERLLEWVAGGGRLVLAAFGESWDPLSLMRSGRTTISGYLSMSALLARLGLRLSDEGDPGYPARVKTRSELTRDIRAISVPSRHRIAPVAGEDADDTERVQRGPARVDIAAGPDAVVMTLPLGKGTIHVLSDVEILANSQIGREDNVVLAANLVLAGGAPDRLYFDEYHHGTDERQPVFSSEREVDPAPLEWMLWGLLAVAAVYAIGRAQRLGAPVPPRSGERRSSRDYVRAFAEIYARAQARDAALAMLALELRRKMARAAGTTPAASPERLGDRLQRRGLPGAQMADLLAELEQTEDVPTDADLVRLGRRIAQYERML